MPYWRDGGRMENSLKALILGASISITCLIISLGFYAARQASAVSASTNEKLCKFAISLEEDDYMVYDGLAVSGSDVVNFMNRNLSSYSFNERAPIYIYVDNGKIQKTYENNVALTQIKDFTSDYYIRPLRKYRGQINRNENDVITGVSFFAE